MKKFLRLICTLIPAFSLLLGCKNEVPGKVITIEQLEAMFEGVPKKPEWDMSKPMLWGYFFTHSSPDKLEAAKVYLKGKGYRFVDIYLSEKDDENEPDKFWLHVEKVEIHTPQSLDKRNDSLYIFANEFGIDTYDGMDVGPIKSE